ncbi:MAG TPA: ornithine carbamoyltransferase [bacterium]|nr:ornithine carbamoyltransferase [bacterium]
MAFFEDTVLKGKHLIGLDDFTREEVGRILDRGQALKAELKSGRTRPSLAGKSVAMIFEKASTRTRVSFQVGIAQLGAKEVFLPGRELQLARGEPIKDSARVLSRYVDAVVIRANRHRDVVEFASWSSVPVINGLTDLLHPCQVLADLFTIREAGMDLDRIKLAFIGDGNNMANSWINASAIFGFELCLACPPGYDPDPKVLQKARAAGANAKIVRDPAAAGKGADVLYTDVWVSMGQEKEKAKRLRAFKKYQINTALLTRAAPGARVLHCLPAHRGQEITDEVIEGKSSIVFDQAENRLHVQKAVLELLILGPGP